MKRYLVEVCQEQLQQLSPEQLELATQVCGERGSRWLLFRDSLLAYKVAVLTGSRVRCGKVVLGQTLPQRGEPCQTLMLGGGAQVVLEAPALAQA